MDIIFLQTVKKSMTCCGASCYMFNFLIIIIIQVEFKTHVTGLMVHWGQQTMFSCPQNFGLVASLTVVLSWWFSHVLFLSSWFSHGGSLMVVLSCCFSHDGSLMVFLSRCHSQLFFVYTLFLSRFLTWVHRLISYMKGFVSE